MGSSACFLEGICTSSSDACAAAVAGRVPEAGRAGWHSGINQQQNACMSSWVAGVVGPPCVGPDLHPTAVHCCAFAESVHFWSILDVCSYAKADRFANQVQEELSFPCWIRTRVCGSSPDVCNPCTLQLLNRTMLLWEGACFRREAKLCWP
jgi:hypothetical protein